VKKVLSLVTALALMLLVVPAMAGDTSSMGEKQDTLYALSKLSTTESTVPPSQMTDDQLAAVEAGLVNVQANACIIVNQCQPQNNNNKPHHH
jgi:uncharacterized protein YktB (UPF0637 family)